MPHVPRRTAPTTTVPPEFMTPPRAHAPIPVPPQPGTKPNPATGKLRVGLGRLSLRGHAVDEKRLVKAMTGKEPEIDPDSGAMYLK